MISTRLRTLALGCALAFTGLSTEASPTLTPRIGVLTDMSGTYSDIAGRGSAVAAEIAVEDFFAKHPEVKGSVISGDPQKKTDEIGRASCRERVCQYVKDSGGGVELKKKRKIKKLSSNT